MSKKTKRQVRKTPSTMNTPAKPPAVSTAAPVSSASSRPSDRYDFRPDYAPVVKDLKRIGMLASTFFVILIALSFILR